MSRHFRLFTPAEEFPQVRKVETETPSVQNGESPGAKDVQGRSVLPVRDNLDVLKQRRKSPFFNSRLAFAAKGLDGIEVGSLPGRLETKDQSHRLSYNFV